MSFRIIKMAKKKSKSKNSKNIDTQTHENGLNFASNALGQAGTVAIGALVSEIMFIAIERLIDKLSKNYQLNNEHDKSNLLTLAISTLQDGLQDFQKPVQQVATDAKETAKSVAGDVPVNAKEGISAVKENVSDAIAEPVSTAKTTANVAVGELFDVAKTVVGAVSTLSSEKHKKKKHKK